MAERDGEAEPRARPNLTLLVFGSVFAATGAAYLVDVAVDRPWAWVLGLTVLALAGLVSAIRS